MALVVPSAGAALAIASSTRWLLFLTFDFRAVAGRQRELPSQPVLNGRGTARKSWDERCGASTKTTLFYNCQSDPTFAPRETRLANATKSSEPMRLETLKDQSIAIVKDESIATCQIQCKCTLSSRKIPTTPPPSFVPPATFRKPWVHSGSRTTRCKTDVLAFPPPKPSQPTRRPFFNFPTPHHPFPPESPAKRW